MSARANTSKLVMRVRFSSPAPQRLPWSTRFQCAYVIEQGIKETTRRNLSRLDQQAVWIGVDLGKKMKQGPVWGGLIGAVTEVEPRRLLCAAETACRVD